MVNPPTLPANAKQKLGRAIFNDPLLSTPPGRACASCHLPARAFTDPESKLPTSEGAVKGIFGRRQTPTLLYVAFSPEFHFDENEQDYLGGQFWDGRAKNLKEQSKGPMLSPLEMNNSSAGEVVGKLKSGPLAPLFKKIFGAAIFDDTEKAFDAAAESIAAYETSPQFAPFSSKYDLYLAGKAQLSGEELRGLKIFEAPEKGNCAACHPSRPVKDGRPPLFTDFTYDNIGLPKNPESPFYSAPPSLNPAAADYVDPGLEATTNRPEDAGRFKVPTLRNIALTPPYFHNGFSKTLEEAVQFYNERDLGGFGSAEVPQTMNREELGNLRLNDQEVSDLIAFLRTLTDGYRDGR